ncbi:MAG: hypothetical protein ACJ8KU_09875 [Chthoniobacterales bacterium]
MSTLSMKPAKQLAILMQNQPGMLARACEAISEAGVEIEALATEAGSFGARGDEVLVRMVVTDEAKAVEALGKTGAMAIETDVLRIEGGNQPGMLTKIAVRLARFHINIESLYVSATSDSARCVVIVRPSDVEMTMRVLADL